MNPPLRAFVLGAGLGTRLNQLTAVLPKPLIPVWNQPLISHAFAHLHAAGVTEFVVNTHHLPETYGTQFPDNKWNHCPITFRHEPILLETGGGLANVADLLESAPFLVCNGDVLSDLPLAPLLRRHQEDGNLVTLALRSTGAAKNVAYDASTGLVRDLRGILGRSDLPQFQFTGIYMVDPAFLARLEKGKKASIVPAFLAAIQDGARIGGAILDQGQWHDLGDRESYLSACAAWRISHPETAIPNIHPTAKIAHGASIDIHSAVGPHAIVGPGSVIKNSILWADAHAAPDARLTNCIVRSGSLAVGTLHGEDV